MATTWTERLLNHKYPSSVTKVKKTMMGIKAGTNLYISTPLEIQKEVVKIKKGNIKTLNDIRDTLAKKHKTDTTCPLTTGIFMNIVANAADEMGTDVPWWRVVKTKGELNVKYPGGQEEHAKRLKAEGHKIDKSRKVWRVEESK